MSRFDGMRPIYLRGIVRQGGLISRKGNTSDELHEVQHWSRQPAASSLDVRVPKVMSVWSCSRAIAVFVRHIQSNQVSFSAIATVAER